MAKEGKIPAVKVEPGRNNMVIVRIPYNQELINKVKTIPGRRWNPDEKYWEVPYEEDLTSRLRTLFGENLIIDPYYYLLPLEKELSIRKYSRKTIKSYLWYNKDLLAFSGKTSEAIDNEDIKNIFITWLKKRKSPHPPLI